MSIENINNKLTTILSDFESKFLDEDTNSKFEYVHKTEMEEVLDNLGYIQLENVQDRYESSLKEIKAGIEAFRKEFAESVNAFSNYRSILFNQDELLTEDELEFLTTITSLEGDFKLHEFTLGEISGNFLLSRVLNWRLSAFSLISQPKEPVLITGVEKYFEKLKLWTNAESYKQVIEYIGDISLISTHIVNKESYERSSFKHIAYFKSDLKGLDHKYDDRYFLLRLNLLPLQSKQSFLKIRETPNNLDLQINDDLNQFMLRLVQLKLWTIGTYDGVLDNEIGPVSFEALVAFQEYLHENYPVGYDINNVLTPVRGDYYAINVTFMFNNLFPIIEEKGQSQVEETIASKIYNMIAGFKDSDKEQVMKEIQSQINETLENEKKRKRKVKNRESKSILQSIGKFFKKTGDLNIEGFYKVIEVLKKFFKWFKNAAKILLREFKMIFKVVKTAMVFFFSKRTVSTNLVTSDFDGNFDCITRIKSYDKNIIENHIRLNQDLTASLSETGYILGKVIHIAIRIVTGPKGWIQLGIEIFGQIPWKRLIFL